MNLSSSSQNTNFPNGLKMGCVFEHTTTEMSERLTDTLKPLLSDPSCKLSKRLQTEAKIQINQNKHEDKITFSGAFSAIILANDIILAHLEQVKEPLISQVEEQIISLLSEQANFSPHGNNSDLVSLNLNYSDSSVAVRDQNVHFVHEIEHFQNEQSIDNGSNQSDKCAQYIGLANIIDQNLSSPNTNSRASSSLNIIEIEPLQQIKEEGITEESDTCKKIKNKNAPEKDIKDDNADRGYEYYSLSSFDQQSSTNSNFNKRQTDEMIPKNHKKQKKINNGSEKEINIDEKDIQHVQCSDRINRTSHYSLRIAKPSSWVKKLLNIESIDDDEGETEDEKQESDPGYNQDQSDNEDESWEEHDSDVEYETDYDDEEHEKVGEYQPSHLTNNSDKEEEQLPNVEKEQDQLGNTMENEREQVSDIEHVKNSVNEFEPEEHCNKKKTTSTLCNKNSDKHKKNEKKTKKKNLHKNRHDFKFIFDHANVDEFMHVVDKNDLEEPVFYQKKKIGKCVRDKKDPSVAESSCNLCTYVNSSEYEKTRSNLRRHFSRLHVERELQFKCEVCCRRFGTKDDLQVHSLKHRFKKCEECGKMILCQRFDVHVQRHNPAFSSPELECDICIRTFVTKLSLKNHIEAIHNAEKRELFPCDICGKVLGSKASLYGHKLFHDPSNKKHLCDICGKSFTTRSQLKKHQVIHNEVPPPQYVCNICQKVFRSKTVLKTHMITHSGERDFLCAECGKAFTQAGALSRHKRTHTGERPFECNLCKKTFNDVSILRRHKLGKHKEKN